LLLHQVQTTLPIHQFLPLSNAHFLPYLAGEHTRHNDPLLCGGFMSLGHGCTPAMLGYAVMEGIVFGLLDAMNAL
jgi:xylulokinase